MARPTKREPALVAKILALMSEGDKPLSLNGACSRSGLDPTTFRDWMRADDSLAALVRVARGKAQATLEERVLDPDISAPSANVIRHRLGALDIDEWGERQVSVDGGSLTLTDLAKADIAAGQ